MVTAEDQYHGQGRSHCEEYDRPDRQPHLSPAEPRLPRGRRRRWQWRIGHIARRGRIRVDHRELPRPGGTGNATGAGPPDTAVLAALDSSPADGYLSAGFLAMPRAMTSSNAGLIAGRRGLGRGGGAKRGAGMALCRLP